MATVFELHSEKRPPSVFRPRLSMCGLDGENIPTYPEHSFPESQAVRVIYKYHLGPYVKGFAA